MDPTPARSTTPAARPGAEWGESGEREDPKKARNPAAARRPGSVKPTLAEDYRAARAGARSARSAAPFFSARSSSQIVIGAAMNQVE